MTSRTSACPLAAYNDATLIAEPLVAKQKGRALQVGLRAAAIAPISATSRRYANHPSVRENPRHGASTQFSSANASARPPPRRQPLSGLVRVNERRRPGIGHRHDRRVTDQRSAMAVACLGKLIRDVLAEQRYRCAVDAVANRQRPPAMITVGRIAEGRVRGEVDIGEVDFVLAAEIRDLTLKVLRIIKLERAALAGKQDVFR